MRERCCLEIGGLTLGFTAHEMGIHLDPDHKAFAIHADRCEVETDLEWASRLAPVRGKKIFDSGAAWSLYENGDELIFDFIAPSINPEPYKRLHTGKDFEAGRVFFLRDRFDDPCHVRALEYPLDELIVTSWLARGRGVEVHGCGITGDDQNSYLFIGHSGAGKSTTTRLWQPFSGVRILSDDRIIIRRDAGRFWIYGTPWHGDAGFAAPEKAPLNQIFLLEHGDGNRIFPLSQPMAAAEVFARCFLPFYDPQALEHTLAFLDDLTRNVPCFKFQFVPDSSAVEKILAFHHSR
jgi:hypothetical protein